MNTSFLRELMHVYSRGVNGLFVMLECYMDDSGTHGGSSVIVWGGVAGHQEYMTEFEDGWNARLKAPCEDRPPIKKFHSVELTHGVGEFEGYVEAERDLTRFNFRKVILDAGLSWISYGISAAAWEKYAKKHLQLGTESAERLIFGKAIMTLCDAAHENKDRVSFQFDKGRESYVATIIQPAVDESRIDNSLVSHGFSSVSQNVALQAADLVAHETYRYLTQYIDNQDAMPDAHLARLLEGAHDANVGWFGPNEIRSMSSDLDASLKKIERSVSFPSKKPPS